MNRALVSRLILKDWYLARATLALVAAAGCASVGVLYLRSETSGFIGLISAFIVTILLGDLLPMQTIVNERKRQNLAFVMSLPISPMEYTTAKILSNVLAFIPIWLAITAGVLWTIAAAGSYGGIIPLTLVLALSPFVAFCLLLAVAIVLESELVAIITMGAFNVSYSFYWFFLLRIPGLQQEVKSPVAIWSRPILSIIAAEVAVIVVALGLTFFFQSRKRDFV
jgi:ABC-2 type transport system permease protein